MRAKRGERSARDLRRPAAFSYSSSNRTISGRNENTSKSKRKPLARITVSEQKLRARRSLMQYWLKRSGYVVATIVIAGCIISALTVAVQPRIVATNNTSTIDARTMSVYEQLAADYIASSFWNRNKITINTAGMTQAILQQRPELTDVSVTLPLAGRKPIVYVTPSQPAFRLHSAHGSYVVDSRGVALAREADAAYISDLQTLPVLADQTGLPVTVGQPYISSEQAQFMQTVAKTLLAKGFAVSEFGLPPVVGRELDVRITDVPYYVKFVMDGDTVGQQAGTFLALHNHLSKQQITPSQYVDVRVPGRAYYL